MLQACWQVDSVSIYVGRCCMQTAVETNDSMYLARHGRKSAARQLYSVLQPQRTKAWCEGSILEAAATPAQVVERVQAHRSMPRSAIAFVHLTASTQFITQHAAPNMNWLIS